jgi:hypothetical protein
MDEAPTDALPDLIFGAARHDATYWSRHPMVAQAETHLQGDWGYVKISLREAQEPAVKCLPAQFVERSATRDAPDLYLFGEGECPVRFFESSPGMRLLQIAIEGPIPGDPRTCWSASIWLANA